MSNSINITKLEVVNYCRSTEVNACTWDSFLKSKNVNIKDVVNLNNFRDFFKHVKSKHKSLMDKNFRKFDNCVKKHKLFYDSFFTLKISQIYTSSNIMQLNIHKPKSFDTCSASTKYRRISDLKNTFSPKTISGSSKYFLNRDFPNLDKFLDLVVTKDINIQNVIDMLDSNFNSLEHV